MGRGLEESGVEGVIGGGGTRELRRAERTRENGIISKPFSIIKKKSHEVYK